MSAPDGRQWLLGRLLWLQRQGAHYRLWAWSSDGRNDQDGAAAGSFLPVGGAGTGGTPLLRPGGVQHAVEIVVLAGEPPDAVMLGGDYVYVRRMQPDFTLSPEGDLTMVEGA